VSEKCLKIYVSRRILKLINYPLKPIVLGKKKKNCDAIFWSEIYCLLIIRCTKTGNSLHLKMDLATDMKLAK
jgi:hypothetical protein